jgi:uncharacterized protein
VSRQARRQHAAPELVIDDNSGERRYEARLDGELAGWVDYGRVHARLVALHTEVLPAYEGRGIASALVHRVLADARAQGVKITPRCPFFVRHFERNPDDADLLAAPLRPRGEGSSAPATGRAPDR